jgi:hypothetical protein
LPPFEDRKAAYVGMRLPEHAQIPRFPVFELRPKPARREDARLGGFYLVRANWLFWKEDTP